ncbi:DUF4231 domain-containing protein [filamentous cyanobacterium LEGE 11480]|uniref:DUF4231 domain-containing protein n=1 Tax=Romeriopsis navalis LEGE 11480 TaxID=2777977 RepID=A0A928VUY4_9CYAN|nr:DUF4231 domain-containing protein [Romeriopsis navalis LEGE 11480]
MYKKLRGSKDHKEEEDYNEQLKSFFKSTIEHLKLEPYQKAYMTGRWLDQMLWMDKKSGAMRNHHQRIRSRMIFASASVPLFVAIDAKCTEPWESLIKLAIVALSIFVTVGAALDEFYSYGDLWYTYRKAAELLKTQGWQFIELSGRYREYEKHSEAFEYFVEDVEGIIQRDVEVYTTEGLKRQEEEKKSNPPERSTRLDAPSLTDSSNTRNPK